MNYSQKIKNIKSIEELQTLHNERIIQLAFNIVLGRKPSSEEVSIYIMKFKYSRDIKKLILAIRGAFMITNPLHSFSLRTRDIYFLLKQYNKVDFI